MRRRRKILKKEKIILNFTNNKKNDGFGSQYLNLIWDIIYCEIHNLNFFYTHF